MSNTETITAEVVTDSPAPHASREIADINSLHRLAHSAADAARQKAAEASHYAILAGTRLESLQKSLPHGEWGKLFSGRKNPLLTTNSAQIGECAEFEFSQDTAVRYINLVKNLRAEQGMSGKAQKRLAGIAAAPEIDDESRAWLEKLTEGRNLRQLYLDLEIITQRDPKPGAPNPPAPPPHIPKGEKQLRLEDAREYWTLWREKGEVLIKEGRLDDLDRKGLEELKKFNLWLRDRLTARLKN